MTVPESELKGVKLKRLGMFDTPDTSGVNQTLDRQALRSIGALPHDEHENVPPAPIAPPNLARLVSQGMPTPPTAAPTTSTGVRRSSRPSVPPPGLKVFEQIPWKDYPKVSRTRLR